MSLFKLKPARESAKSSVLVADLDKLITERVAFKFGGQTHYINPITTAEFFKVTSEMAKLDSLKVQKEVSAKELIDSYTALIGSVCETITRDHISSMTQAQVGALFQLVLDCVTGKAYAEKKTLANQVQ